MTTEQAIAIATLAALAKPKHRRPLDKLHGTTDQITAVVDALAKSYDAMDGTLAKAQAQLNQIAADVEFIKNFEPGQPPRRFHS